MTAGDAANQVVNPTRIFHVSPDGRDQADGSADSPLRHISAAARLAMPGDTIRVHAGVYRERVDPPRGGSSEDRRITYEAAEGEMVEIRGSEVVEGWHSEGRGLWRADVPNSLFGDYNPFAELIRGDWFKDCGRPHHTAAVYLDGEWLTEAAARDDFAPLHWWADVGQDSTVIRAHFGGADPNGHCIEVNVRPTVFYPRLPGINFLAVRGFTICHAATNWAPPTAEQIGAIGTHWSKGWLIEHNTVSHSRCVGITLGKHGDEFDNTSADTARGYVETIERAAQEFGWCRENIGSHVVRHNHVHHCEQAGIVGSLGAIFSEITDNEVHHIHVQQLFGGEEQAALKFHAAIDTLIARNHLHHSFRGLWLDWMSQGTRVSGNLFHHNSDVDLFLEVNHGPCVIDHNLMLSAAALTNWSQGGAFVHNLIAGKIRSIAEPNRQTPWHPPHETELAGIAPIRGGGEIYLNNLIADASGFGRTLSTNRDALTGDWTRDPQTNELPVHAHASETFPTVHADNLILSACPLLEETAAGWMLNLNLGTVPAGHSVTTERLGKCAANGLPYEDVDGSPLRFPVDYLGQSRHSAAPGVGPFESLPQGPVPVSPLRGSACDGWKRISSDRKNSSC